jgi:hypothetical protein
MSRKTKIAKPAARGNDFFVTNARTSEDNLLRAPLQNAPPN